MIEARIRGNFYRRGAVAVEFGFVIVLMMLIVGGLIEFGRVFWYLDALTKATRDGARYLSTVSLPIDTDDATATALVKAAATQAGLPGFDTDNVVITCDPDCDTPDYVTVSVTGYSVGLGSWFPSLTWASGNLPLGPHTTMRYMQ